MDSYLENIRSVLSESEFIPFKGIKHYPQDKLRDYIFEEIKKTIKNGADIVFNGEKNTFFVLEKLDWDTKHFGFPCGKISFSLHKKDIGIDSILDALGRLIGKAKEKGLKHISALLDIKDFSMIESFERSGFLLKGVLVDLISESKRISSNEFISPAKIGLAKEEDIEKLAEISYKAFSRKEDWLDRFHADPFFSKEKSDLLYREWLLNSFKGLADAVLCAYVDGEPVGFITLKIEKEKSSYFGENYGIVPLNAVSLSHRRKGIYRDLVIAGCNWFAEKGIKYVSVRTQASTIAVQKVWHRLGADTVSYNLVFHKVL